MNINIREIVGQFLNSSEQSSHQFMRLYNMAVWGLKTEFNLDIVGRLVTRIIEVEPNKTAPLPSDYIAYSKLGVLNERGEVVTFKRNSGLSNILYGKNRTPDGTLVRGSVDPLLLQCNSPYYYGFYDSDVSYTLFGLNSGTQTIGEYNIDEGSKTIFLSPDNHYTSLVLEYLSSGCYDEDEEFEVPVTAAEAMIAYLRWNNAKDQRKKFGFNEVMGLKREFYREKRLAKMRINKANLQEITRAETESRKLVAKV